MVYSLTALNMVASHGERKQMKQYRLKALLSWRDKLQNTPGASRLRELDIDRLASKLTADQLAMVNSLISAAYTDGSETTRKYWAPKYHAQRQEIDRLMQGQGSGSMGILKLVKNN